MKSKINVMTLSIVLFSLLITNNIPAQTKDSSENNLHRTIQVSFLPCIGTGGFLSDQVTCDLSLNILAGYVKEVRSAEFGGLFNVVRENAGKCQMAGLGNMVGGTSSGLQWAGIINLSKKLKGIQIAGNINLAGEASGMQIAGLLNNTKRNAELQIAGLVNNASGTSGVQISGLVNHTSFLKGIQIGLVNISDSCQGIPIGLISLVKNGYHKIEISGDEMFYTNVAFRSGVKKFHSIIIAGIRPDNFSSPLWTYGCGAGSSFSLGEKTLFDIDATLQNVIKEDHVGNNYLGKLAVGVDHQLKDKTSIYIGISYNFLAADTKYGKYAENFSSIAPYHFTDNTWHNGYNLKTWAGIKVGLRFL